MKRFSLREPALRGQQDPLGKGLVNGIPGAPVPQPVEHLQGFASLPLGRLEIADSHVIIGQVRVRARIVGPELDKPVHVPDGIAVIAGVRLYPGQPAQHFGVHLGVLLRIRKRGPQVLQPLFHTADFLGRATAVHVESRLHLGIGILGRDFVRGRDSARHFLGIRDPLLIQDCGDVADGPWRRDEGRTLERGGDLLGFLKRQNWRSFGLTGRHQDCRGNNAK